MIIDKILDRRDAEENYLKAVLNHAESYNFDVKTMVNETIHYSYDARQFYYSIMAYTGKYADDITRALDYGTESDVKKALCKYVIENEYNPDICDYINNRNWIYD